MTGTANSGKPFNLADLQKTVALLKYLEAPVQKVTYVVSPARFKELEDYCIVMHSDGLITSLREHVLVSPFMPDDSYAEIPSEMIKLC